MLFYYTILLTVLAVMSSLSISNAATPSFKIDYNPQLSLVKQYNGSQLYTMISTGYADPIMVANLTGSHYEMGFSLGVFLANEAYENYLSLFKTLVPNFLENDALEVFLDWQWDDYLSKQFPQEFSDEINGFNDGAVHSGFTQMGKAITRCIVLSSFPGDAGQNIEYLLINELKSEAFLEYIEKKGVPHGKLSPDSMQCSHFSVWGDRTVQGEMYNGRNLDWIIDTGIAKHKLLTFFHPTTGGNSHVAVGFAGLFGAITGISSKGIFVAESDNDSDLVTFDGMSWAHRLRYVMQYANNIEDALNIWKATNNTMGMNHMLSSAFEVDTVEHPAYALETMKGYTAFFPDNDTLESAYIYVDPNTGDKTQMGYPIPQAVYRTNHGYDPLIRKYQYQLPGPGDDTMIRYMLLYNAFEYYQSASIAIDELAAINITSTLGAKGNEGDFFDCSNANTGMNVISAAFHAANSTMYVAFEEGTGNTRICACCGTYVQVDLSLFFGQQQQI
ncbi:hypothetical protein DFA_12230 [Cavenderia fasciculata]|uniref:Phospholipase B-like n=1 Tax=Cavenderia fasciculata TaxID=261658 RepID=F4QCN0_CACFS|nr:uncharacterized protein DFA_12230 [Cavenderia fasciculata]EGG14458.1 hypothetical protein DFA_12230 [Cavenderia fasciculata]|eukprot:XP_004353867.1 hypothetical protein DFA_12230 [Cavenderia fasciculata]